MIRTLPSFALAALFLLAGRYTALAEQVVEEVTFDGEKIQIVETDDYEKAVRIGDRELGRNYFAGLDRMTEVAGQPVVLFSLGDGGNACGPSTLIVWRDGSGEIQSYDHDTGCDAPTASVAEYGIWFVPYLRPGGSAPVTLWTPQAGISTEGRLTYAPEPGTGWADIDPASIDYAMDLFRNEALYNAAAARIGDGDLEYYATGLAVSSAPQLENRLFTGEGCYPHNCGGADSLIVVDKAKGEVYLAQQRDTGITAWPEASQWPEPARAILDRFSAARQ